MGTRAGQLEEGSREDGAGPTNASPLWGRVRQRAGEQSSSPGCCPGLRGVPPTLRAARHVPLHRDPSAELQQNENNHSSVALGGLPRHPNFPLQSLGAFQTSLPRGASSDSWEHGEHPATPPHVCNPEGSASSAKGVETLARARRPHHPGAELADVTSRCHRQSILPRSRPAVETHPATPHTRRCPSGCHTTCAGDPALCSWLLACPPPLPPVSPWDPRRHRLLPSLHSPWRSKPQRRAALRPWHLSATLVVTVTAIASAAE